MADPIEPPGRPDTHILWRVYLAVLATAVLIQALVPLARIATTYKTLDHALPVSYIGIISGAFAILPVFFAVAIGRMNDRGYDGVAMLVGSAFLTIAICGLWLVKASFVSLFAFTSLLGMGQMLVISASQAIVARCTGADARDSALGNFMVAASLGQMIGPAILIAVAAAPRASHTDVLLEVSFWGALGIVAVSALLVVVLPKIVQSTNADIVPLGQILRMPGLFWIIVASSLCVTAGDLILVYFPALGADRGLGAGAIGWLLSLRAAVAMVSRLFLGRLARIFGRTKLMVVTMLSGAVAIGFLALPLPIWGLAICMIVIGFGIPSPYRLRLPA